jgi:hypothetical protein
MAIVVAGLAGTATRWWTVPAEQGRDTGIPPNVGVDDSAQVEALATAASRTTVPPDALTSGGVAMNELTDGARAGDTAIVSWDVCAPPNPEAEILTWYCSTDVDVLAGMGTDCCRLPDEQSSVTGNPGTAGDNAIEQVVAPPTTADTVTVPPAAGRVDGVADVLAIEGGGGADAPATDTSNVDDAVPPGPVTESTMP